MRTRSRLLSGVASRPLLAAAVAAALAVVAVVVGSVCGTVGCGAGSGRAVVAGAAPPTPSPSAAAASPSPSSAATATRSPIGLPPSGCGAGGTTRVCSAMEQVAVGGRTPTGLCLCPGVGARRSYVLNITYVDIPGLLEEQGPRRLTGVNGTVPGPAIVATEGEWLVVTVVNSLLEPTVVHWHGMMQVGTPQMDGVPTVTQCAIAPGGMMTYAFRATIAGTYCALMRARDRRHFDVDSAPGGGEVRHPPSGRAHNPRNSSPPPAPAGYHG